MPRTRCSARSAVTRVFDAVWRCTAGSGPLQSLNSLVPGLQRTVRVAEAALRPGHEPLLLVQRQAFHHRATAEFQAQLVDRVLGLGRAAIDEVGEIVAAGVLQIADADAD